jgi:hypothetical protein
LIGACRFDDGEARVLLSRNQSCDPMNCRSGARPIVAVLAAVFVALVAGCSGDRPGSCRGVGGLGRGGGQAAGGSGGNAGDAGMSGTAGIGGSGAGIAGAPGTGGSPCACPSLDVAPRGIAAHPSEGSNHTGAVCDFVCYQTMPPSSGTHYPAWPVYKTYVQPVPWGFLVHGLEHGAVEIFYNCPNGCADEIAEAQAFIDALPGDVTCGGARPRVVLAPAPDLDVRWAAAAWLWTLRADTFDRALFAQFFDDHYDHGPEVICQGGSDLSTLGWCQ